MNKIVKLSVVLLSVFLWCSQSVTAQKSIKEYVSKYNIEKIKKSIAMDVFTRPATQKSFKDGHGKNPYFSSKEQLPDTIALITFHINDLGFSESWEDYLYIYTKYYSVSKSGGNKIANEIQKETIAALKAEFKKRGVVLLTPDEYLNTPEKIAFYNDEFAPKVSRMGKFLSNFENRNTDISVCASGYRYLDMGASFDYKRSISLGWELTNKLGVDGVLSIGVEIQSKKKEAYTRLIKMALHGPNPNQRVDKKYFGQKTGTGYYDGQLYAGGTLVFKRSIKTIELGKEQIKSMDFEGFDIIFKSFIEKFYDVIDGAIEKVSK